VSRPLPRYPRQADRDRAGAAAGWIALGILLLVMGLAFYAVLHLAGLVP